MNKLGHYGKCTLDRNAMDFPQRLKSTVFPSEIHNGKSAPNREFVKLWNFSVEKVKKKKSGQNPQRKFMIEDFAVDLHCFHNKIRNNKLSLWNWCGFSPLKSMGEICSVSATEVNFDLDTVQFLSAVCVLDFLKFHAHCCDYIDCRFAAHNPLQCSRPVAGTLS